MIRIQQIRAIDRERFAALCGEPNADDCVLWQGPINPNGYGRFRYGIGGIGAHRFAYEQAKGRIPDRHVIDHLCAVRACVNPAHLEAVTARENVRRGGLPHLPQAAAVSG